MKSSWLLTFYADTPQEQNRKFYWRIYSRSNALKRLKHFVSKGWKIRAAWLVNKELCINERIV